MIIVDKLPVGWRWANEVETETMISKDDFSESILVRVGGTDDETWADVAVRA